MSKGSNRRPQQEDDEAVSESWARIFPRKPDNEPSESPEANDQSKGE